MLLDIAALASFVIGIFLMLRWIHAAIRGRTRRPAPPDTFTLEAMRDRRYRRRGGIYLGTSLLCIGLGLFLSGMAVQV